MLQFPLTPKTEATLKAQADPSSVPGGQRQALAHILYDTQPYPAAGANNLTFFTVARANRFLSNLDTPGALQSGQFLEVYAIAVDLFTPAALANAQADLFAMLYGTAVAALGGPTLELEYNSKLYGPWPLRAFHGLGGVTGFSTFAGAETANNSHPDGGFYLAGPDPMFGGLTFGPNQGFSVTLRWPALAPLPGAVARDLQVSIAGALHRKVV